MCNWQDIIFPYARGKIRISADTIRDACEIIRQAAQKKRYITYTELMDSLKDKGHRKINRGTIGKIVGEVSTQISQVTSPSVYPSAIVVNKNTSRTGHGFWGLDAGTAPPSEVPPNQRTQMLRQYQNDVFNRNWSCDC